MRKSTGGARNILDLSKLGQIESGSVKGTPYEHSNPARMYGGIKFFDIDPEDTSRQKISLSTISERIIIHQQSNLLQITEVGESN